MYYGGLLDDLRTPFTQTLPCGVKQNLKEFFIDSISHSIHLEKLPAHSLDGCALLCTKNGWLGPESGGEWSYLQAAISQKCCSPGLSAKASPVY